MHTHAGTCTLLKHNPARVRNEKLWFHSYLPFYQPFDSRSVELEICPMKAQKSVHTHKQNFNVLGQCMCVSVQDTRPLNTNVFDPECQWMLQRSEKQKEQT